MTVFPKAIDTFVDALNLKHEDYKFTVERLRKYARIVRQPIYNGKTEDYQKSVYLFVDVNGNVYKPAGWNRPAQTIRAFITDSNAESLADITDPFGTWLYLR